MEPIPSLRILKYFFYDQYHIQKQQKKQMNTQLHEEILKAVDCFQIPLPRNKRLIDLTYTVFDLETTGFFPKLGDEIISIGAVKMNLTKMKDSDNFYEIVTPIQDIPNPIYSLTGLTKEQIKAGISFEAAFLKFLQFSKDTVLVAHPASFDVHFLEEMAKRWGIRGYRPAYLDSYALANFIQPKVNNKLDHLVEYFQIEEKKRHHALNDAQMTAEIFTNILLLVNEAGTVSVDDFNEINNKKKGRI